MIQLFVSSRLPEAMEDVVFVGADDEFADWETHLLGKVPCENVSEIPRGHCEADLIRIRGMEFPTQREVRVKIIGDLSEDSGPVDRIHRGEMLRFLNLFVGEQRLDDILAIIKRAVDGQTVHVGVEDRGHLRFLHGADASLREHDEHRDVFLVAKTVDGGRAGI